MKKILLLMTLIITVAGVQAQNSFYDLSALTIDGREFSFQQLKGKKVIIVNTASKCGYTPQYKDLETLYKQYRDKGLVILGFPANNFMSQEPGTNDQIREFCAANYGVTFQMMSKISVKGDDMSPVYSWLTQKSLNGVMDTKVKWNFQKYMINEDGTLWGMAESSEKPGSERIINWINGKQ